MEFVHSSKASLLWENDSSEIVNTTFIIRKIKNTSSHPKNWYFVICNEWQEMSAQADTLNQVEQF